MIILDASTKLQVIFAAAKAANDCKVIASYSDGSQTSFALSISTTNGVTAVDIVAATASREIKSIQMYNADTSAVTATFRTNNSGTLATCFKATLSTGDTVSYEDGIGWSVINNAGLVKGNVPLASYRLMRAPQVLTSGTSYTIPTGCTAIFIEMIGGGGGGGGTTGAANKAAVGGGGSCGGYLRKFIASPQTTAITYALAAGGTAGSTSGGDGGLGGDTTLTCNSVTYTAKGGNGGKGMLTNTTVLSALGGLGVIPTNGDQNVLGKAGLYAVRQNGSIAVSGSGSSFFGGGANGIITAAAGTNATNNTGGGASGGCSLANTARAGGVGGSGIIIIHEYM